MSVSSEVQRTLVKSPPELWAELSDPATLARHLGELGEVRIVRTEPDRAVDWEAAAADGAQAHGRVEIEPSGWGTRVTLSASRLPTAPESSEPEPEAETEPVVELEPQAAVEPEIEPEPQPESAAIETLPGVEPEPQIVDPDPEIVEPGPRRGFFARLFRRRKAQPEPVLERESELEPIVEAQPIGEPEPIIEGEPGVLAATEIAEPASAEPSPQETAPEDVAPAEPITVAPGTEPDISAELAALEEQTTAMLTGVLDRLGAAHHRPFSRS
jgi:hypothetical protein